MILAILLAFVMSREPVSLAVRIPFTWTPGQIEIAVQVNGVPATFLLDTGSEYSIVSSRLAAQLKLPTERVLGRDFANGVDLRIDEIPLPNQRVMVMPFDGYYARGRTIDGLIGYDFFDRFMVTIDFTRHVLTVRDPNALEPPAAVAVPIEFSGRLPVVVATLALQNQKRLPVRLMVDTGASQSVILRHPFATANGLLDLVNPESKTTRAPSLASGDLQLVDIPVDSLSLARWTFDRPRVQAHPQPTGSGGYTDTDGLIGNTLLSRFVLTVDYPRKRLLLEPIRHAG